MSSRHRHPVRGATPPDSRTPLLLRATVGGAVVLAVVASMIRASGAEPASETAAVAGRSLSPVAQRITPDAAAGQGGLSCRVRYTVSPASDGRFTALLTVVNTGSTDMTGWTLRWRDPTRPTIVGSWNSTVVADADRLLARNVSANRVLAAGSGTTIGFVGTGDGASPGRSRFVLNGTRCR